MKPCQLVRAHKVILPSNTELGSDTESPLLLTQKDLPVSKVSGQKSSGVAKFIKVSVWEDVMSFLLSAEMKLESACSCQHTIILISFALHLICHLYRVKGHGRWLLKRLLIFDIYHFNLPFPPPLPPPPKNVAKSTLLVIVCLLEFC